MSLNQIKDYFIDRFVRRFTAIRVQTTDSTTKTSELTLKDVMMKLEPIFVSLQSLMIWDKPYLSAIAFVVFNCLYWLFVYFNRFRFYAFVFFALFCINFLKLWTQYVWPEIRVPPNESTDTEGWTPIHPQVLSAPEINYYINELCVISKSIFLWFAKLRREKRFHFCLIITSLLVMTAIIGRLVPGVIIVYSIMMTMALGPGIVLYVFPDGLYDLLRNLFVSNQNNDETDRNEDKSEDKNDISERQLLSESALHQYLIKSEFKDYELNPFDNNDDSSLQLLSDTQLDITLDKELGIDAQLSDDDLKLDSLGSHSSSSVSGAIRFVSTHFSRNSSSDNFEDEFELIYESELGIDLSKGSQNNKQTDV